MSESPVPGAASQSPVNLPETKSTAEPGIVLVRKLASTSGSRLWLAKRGETQVVIKVPKPVKGDEKQTRKHVEHVINEYNVLRSLQKLKPDLAVVFPLREVDQTLIRTNGVELPYMEAGDLFEMAVALPRMDEAEVRVIFAPVAGTLAWMHANRFVHRDIKPENILMDKVKGGPLFKPMSSPMYCFMPAVWSSLPRRLCLCKAVQQYGQHRESRQSQYHCMPLSVLNAGSVLGV